MTLVGEILSRNIYHCISCELLSAIAPEDYVEVMESLSFLPGFSDGDMVCTNVTVLADLMVECDETFSVHLGFISISKNNLLLGVIYSTVTLVDSDGKNGKHNFVIVT